MIKKRELQAGVFIDDNLTRMEREMQGSLRNKTKEEKAKGNYVKMGYEKILTMRNTLLKDYVWECIYAKKEHKKGRAKSRKITATRKNLREVKVKKINKKMMEIKLKYNGNKEEENYLLVGGDFNIKKQKNMFQRTGNKRGLIREKDVKERSEIRKSIEMMNRKGYTGKKGEWTYIEESGSSVTDYVIGNDKVLEEIKTMEEGNRTESDHILLEMDMCAKYCNIEYIWLEIREKVTESITKVKKKVTKDLQRSLRDLRKKKICKEKHIDKRKKYKRWCKTQKKIYEEEEER
ncbi:hypothetical protein P5V15_001380 [Pogonomyrmex californicus]